MRYQIRIDNENYEGSGDLHEAIRLYETVDKTCLHQYIGHTKSLVQIQNQTELVVTSDAIIPTNRRRQCDLTRALAELEAR